MQFDLPVFALPAESKSNEFQWQEGESVGVKTRRWSFLPTMDHPSEPLFARIGIGLVAIAYSEIDTARRSRWPYLKERGQRFRCIHAGLKRRRGVLKMECCHQGPTCPLRIVPSRRVALRDLQCRSVHRGRNRLNPTTRRRIADQGFAGFLETP